MIEILGRGLDVDIKETRPLSFKCRCSRERILAALGSLDMKSLEELAQDKTTEAHCEFCNSTYEYTQDEIKHLLEEKEKQAQLEAAKQNIK